jgi:phosphoribosyl-AMP cyclohydrolase
VNASDPDGVRFGPDGLIPVVTQEVDSGDVLMLAFMNREALELTQATGRAYYWSRSRQKLWRKGETSGNEQVVQEILINCEQNSLLLKVSQIGAVCHEGYATCYYRTVNDDGSLSVVRERVFDPATVYGATPSSAGSDPLIAATKVQFGAYVYLRDNDLESESGTSRRLRGNGDGLRVRVADELRELAGVLDGEHRHSDFVSDVLLEASQAIYWVLLVAIQAGATWEQLRPDRALANSDESLPAATMAKLLRVDAHQWQDADPGVLDAVSSAHATLALIGQACRNGGLDPLLAVQTDLSELRGRSYLSGYFASTNS